MNKIQNKAWDYMEKTYGKKWEERLKQSTPSITNAYIGGYKDKEKEDKTASKVLLSQKRFDKICSNLEQCGQLKIDEVVGLPVIVEKHLPDHLGCLVDDKMSVLAFIEFKKQN